MRNPLPAQRLAPDEGLALDTSEQVAEGRDGEEDGGGDEAADAPEKAEPLGEGHGGVRGGAHVVGRHLADGRVEARRGRADPQQERHLNEEDDERRDPIFFFYNSCQKDRVIHMDVLKRKEVPSVLGEER